MKELAVLLKAMNIYAHNAHNLVTGPQFFQDHEFLAEAYAKYDADYDDVVERMLGADKKLDLVEVHRLAIQKIAAYPQQDVSIMLMRLLALELELCNLVERVKSSATEGTKQLIGDIANFSEMRQYKLRHRLLK